MHPTPTGPRAAGYHLNPVDRIVAWFNPRAGLQRAAARHVLNATVTPAYESATPGRNRKFYRDGLSPNQLVQLGAPAIRAQARHMQRNNDLARGILRTMVNNVVGPTGIGIEPQPRRLDGSIHEELAAELRELHREWALRPEVTKTLTYAGVQRALAYAWIRDGEVFAQELVGPVPGFDHGHRVPFSLELIESDFCPFDHNEGDRIRQGLERNAWGQTIAMWFHKGHPGDSTTTTRANLKRVTADRVHHLAFRDRIGQARGVSEFASIIARLEDIKDYEESERIAAKIAAALTGFVKRTSPDGYSAPPNATIDPHTGLPAPRSIGLAPGMIIDTLAVGEEIGLIASERPNPNLITFRSGQLRAVAGGIGASYSSIARDYNGTFSSQRQELVEQWVHYATMTDELTGQFLQPAWTTEVNTAVLSKTIKLPKDLKPGTLDDALYIAQAMPWIDPLKEANAYLVLAKAGFASEVEIMRRRGVNPRDLLDQVATWRKQCKDRGVAFDSDAALQAAVQAAVLDGAGGNNSNSSTNP